MALSALLRSTLSRAPLFAASRVLSSKVPDTSFLTDNYQSEVFKQGAEASISGQFAPYRPDNWKELLATAQAAYPERAGPRRNKRAERERNRRWVIQQQHKTTKKQKYAAHDAKQLKIKAEVGKMRENFVSFGFAPALEFALLTGSAKSAGLGGRLGDAYFGPLFRDGNFDPNWQGKKNADTVVRLDPL